ncbi:tetratricopeptide repeat protein [Prochlorococcus sp. MIT 1300]|uniref:O-linked N-acetylglucosamine transferase family protein n=1 Tax=Prochlorococcus sp. MIT 1300 TaxID=3096218 RepID=UPI002A762AFF|nr:tetratricopeptide repeat protein [Prochlorococcus sp. MIT 1300]
MSSKESDLRQKAWLAHHQGLLGNAEELYRQLLTKGSIEAKIDCRDAINLGALLRSQGRLKEARAHYHHYLKIFPQEVSLRLNGINALFELEDHIEAKGWIDQGIQSHPGNIDLRLAQAKNLRCLKHINEARQVLEQLIQNDQNRLGVWLDLGLICHQQQDWSAALSAFERATKLDPEDPRSYANRITVLQEKGDFLTAQNLIRTLPNQIATNNLVQGAKAGLLIKQQKFEEAEALLTSLCINQPDNPINWLNRAACLRSMKIMGRCTWVLKQGLRWNPGHADLEQSLGQSLAEMGKHKQAMELLQRSAGPIEQLTDTYLMNLQFLGAGYHLISSTERQKMSLLWEGRKKKEGVGDLWGDVIHEDPNKRALKVGYLSADFANHPVGRFILPIIESHDRRRVEVWGLNCTVKEDELSTKIKNKCNHWLNIRFGTDLEIARLISDLKLDILVELGGFTGNSRIGICIHRPAPIQLSYLGFYAPTYLQSIDGWIGDQDLFDGLQGIDKQQNLLKVSGGYMAFKPEVEPKLRERVANKYFQFGCFNHSRKLTQETIDLFCKVLEATPEAQLVLKSISFVEEAEQDRIRDLFEDNGLANERLVILPWVEGWLNHVSLYQQVDVALDPLPYGGATTTCEALMMGVPVLTIAGEGMVGRLSASILMNGGFKEWVCQSESELIKKAIKLSKQGPRNLKERQKVREILHQSPLSDAKRLTNELEEIYYSLTKRHVSKEIVI